MKKFFSLVTGVILISSILGTGLFAQSYTLPQANFILFPTVGEATTAFAFDASDSTNGGGNNRGLQYRWKFKTNQDWTSFSGSAKTTFVPMDSGHFRAILQIKDPKTGQTQTTYRTYTARTHFDRRANLYADPIKPKAGQPVRFWIDVFKIRHEDVDDIQVRWDFDGNNEWDTPFSTHKESWHTFGFNQIQRISPRAEVKYNDGTTIKVDGLRSPKKSSRYRSPTRESGKTKIKVSSPSVVAPILEVSPGSTGAHPNTQFIFDVTKSKIPRGGWIEWSFDNDAFQKGPHRIRKQFDTPGDHTVQAQICTGIARTECAQSTASFRVKGPKTSFWVEATAQQSGSNSKLTKVSEQHYQGFIGQKVVLRATTKTPGNTAAPGIRYLWDFDGDGQWDTGTSTQSQQTYTFRKNGRFYPTVEAISSQGVKARSTLVLDIAGNTAPTGSIILSQNTIVAGQTLTISPKLEDTESPYGDLEIRFDANGDGKWDGGFTNPRSIQWKYDTPRKYVIRMQVRDPYNQTHTSEATLIVQQNPLFANRPRNKRCGSCNNEPQEEWEYRPNGQNGANTNGSEGNKKENNSNQGPFFTGTESKNTPGTSHTGNRYQSPRAGQSELRIPIAAPVLDIHKDFKGYVEYATGWEDAYRGPSAVKPWTTPTTYGVPHSGVNLSVPNSADKNKTASDLPPQSTTAPIIKNQTKNDSSSFLNSLSTKYANTPIQPPYPGENPFVDVSSSDWYYDIAVQAYRDGLATGTYFFQ